jgi:hypothetical protein
MTTARRRYELALGVAFVVVGGVILLPLVILTLWIWSRHMYTVGLSVDIMHAAPFLLSLIIGFGVLFVLGGIALLRRS